MSENLHLFTPNDKITKHRELIVELDNLLTQHNPCNIKNGACRRGRFCCSPLCTYSGPKGCTINALLCKVWLCAEAMAAIHKEAKMELYRIYLMAMDYEINMARASIGDCLRMDEHNTVMASFNMPWGRAVTIPLLKRNSY